MSIVALTPDQTIALAASTRFQLLVRNAMYNQANYWLGQDGSAPPGNDLVRWAKSRFISAAIIIHPNSQDYASWVEQFRIKTKDMPVFDNAVAFNIDTVLDYMLNNSKFDELADLVFNLRIQNLEF